MSSDDIRIRVEGLSKRYEIYAQPSDRLKQMILPRLQCAVGRTPKTYFREFWALHDVTFNVKRGETVGIVGRNGSGKSTLLQMICGTIQSTSGRVAVDGRISALLELGAGFNPEFTGRENVLLSGLVYGISESEIQRRFDEILDFSGIGDFIEQPVKTYSSGMYVRLAFAVAINVSPDLLVVDEALAVGDEAFQRKCLARIKSICESGATVLFVSHSAGAVIELCDRAILLDGGEMLMEGTPKMVVTKYQKLLYAPRERADGIRQEILEAYCGGAGELALATPTSTCDGTPSHVMQKPNEYRDDKLVDEAYWEEGLVSASAITYERQGACIDDPHVETLDGVRVNVLTPDHVYIYRYNVHVERTLANVRCGMMVRSVTGVEIGGAASMLPQHALSIANAGDELAVCFRFRCMFRPGTYFMSAGVLAALGEAEDYVDRRVDAIVFKVMPSATRLATGFVNLLDATPEVSIVA